MAEENKIRDAADAVKGVVEAVPIYQDLLQPAVKEVGTGLQTIAKTIHIALAPVSAMVWGYEKISDHLNKKLAEKLKDTPPDRIVTPNPAVAGPTVEALRFTANEPALREMYTNLLATSMDAETAQNAHPAFVQTIRQMVADEARIVNLIAAEESVNISQIPPIEFSNMMLHEQVEPVNIPRHTYLIKKSQCVFPGLIPSYLDNLRRLGITQHEEGGWHSFECNYDRTITCVKQALYQVQAATDTSIGRVITLLLEEELSAYKGRYIAFQFLSEQVKFTSFGKQFVDACVIPPSSK